MLDRGELTRKLLLNAARLSGASTILSHYMRGIGAILMLHRVNNAADSPLGINRHLTITPAFLDAVLTDMARRGYLFVSMDEALDRIAGGAGNEKFAAFTADDAYRDNLTDALPVFERHGAPLTIYVSPGIINGTRDLWWNVLEEIVAERPMVYVNMKTGRVAFDCSTPAKKVKAGWRLHDYFATEVPEQDQQTVLRDIAGPKAAERIAAERVLMDWDEIRSIARHPLVTIGAHTVHHYNLKRLPEDQARDEMADAARILEIELGERPRHMAYPYGYVDAVCTREVRLAREAGFESAVTTRHGVLRHEHAGHLHALPRISVNGRYQKLSHIRTMLSGVTTPLANAGKRIVTV